MAKNDTTAPAFDFSSLTVSTEVVPESSLPVTNVKRGKSREASPFDVNLLDSKTGYAKLTAAGQWFAQAFPKGNTVALAAIEKELRRAASSLTVDGTRKATVKIRKGVGVVNYRVEIAGTRSKSPTDPGEGTRTSIRNDENVTTENATIPSGDALKVRK